MQDPTDRERDLAELAAITLADLKHVQASIDAANERVTAMRESLTAVRDVLTGAP